MAFLFEKLEVYQKAVSSAADIAKLTDSFPRDYCFLTDQLNLAALSLAANFAEVLSCLRARTASQLYMVQIGRSDR